jgi:hypothetical protein
LKDVIRTSSRVTAVSRLGFDKAKTRGREKAPFEIRYQNGKGPETLRADAVIDASGTWHSPNPAGANGLPAIGEREVQSKITYAMPDVLGRDRERFAGKTVAVLGAGHSAIGTLTDLTTLAGQAPGTDVIWLLRGNDPAKAFGGGANDKLVARGELGTHFASLVAWGLVRVEAGFFLSHITSMGDRPCSQRVRLLRASCRRRRTDRRDRLPARSVISERGSPASGPGDRGAHRTSAPDRSERAQLRDGPAARRP